MASGNKITTTGVLYINGTQVENTFTNISKITRKLESELRKLTPGTQEFINKAEEVKVARKKFEEVKQEINAVTKVLDNSRENLSFFRRNLLSLGDTFRQVFTADLASKFLDNIVQKSKQTVSQLLEIADAMTDVQKTSGMTLEQVKNLWTQFDEFDTRTSKLDRLKIAEVGGRLGVPIEEMKDFVREIDKAYVALGDSFEGGLEAVVNQLGKIKGLFQETNSLSYAEAINRVGSALNSLAANGVATESNISDFTLRVGALPEALRPSIDKVLGLGAAFQEAGIDSEIASSGFSRFISTAGKEIESFAYSMNMGVEEAKKLLNTKPEEFFLRFAEGMKGLDATQTATVLKSLKLNTLEVQKAVGAAANKTDEFKSSMKLAGQEMEKMTSLLYEFNQKNNNAPAILEKIKNEFFNLFTSTNIINNFEWLVNILGKITGVTKDAGEEVSSFKERLQFLGNIILVLVSSVISYNLALNVLSLTTKSVTKQTILYNLAQKAKVTWDILAKGTTLLLAAAKLRLTGNTARATVAMRAFNIATKSNPIGLLVGLLTAAVVAYKSFSKEVSLSVKNQKDFNAAIKDTEKNVVTEISNLKVLYKTATDVTKSTEERTAAVKKLKEEYPSYFKSISDEIIMNGKAEGSYKSLRDAIISSARASAARKVIEKREGERLEEDRKIKEKLEKKKKELAIANADPKKEEIRRVDGGDGKMTTIVISNDLKIKGRKIELKEVQDEIAKIKKEREVADKFLIDAINDSEKKAKKYNDDKNKNQNTNVVVSDNKEKSQKKGIDLVKNTEQDLKKAQQAAKKYEELNKSLNDKELELLRSYEDEKRKIVAESREQAIKDEQIDFSRKQVDIKRQNEALKTEIQNAEKEIENIKKSKKETKSPQVKNEYDNAIKSLATANEKRKNLQAINDSIMEQMQQTHQFNLNKIKVFWDQKDFEQFVNKEHARINALRRADEDEINNITTLAEAKEKLQNLHYLKLSDTELRNIRSLEDAKRYLREEADRKMLAAQLITLEASKKALEKSISELSDGEAKNKLLADLETLKDKITQIKGAINGGKESDNKSVIEEDIQKKGKVDILGFTAQEWEDTFKHLDRTQDKIRALGTVFSAMGNLAASFGELQRSLGERDLRRFKKQQSEKQKELLKQLNQGYISQEEYHKEIELLDSQLANKKAEIEYKQAKAEKVSRLFSAIGATAQGVANSLAIGGPIGIAFASIIGALGAIQIATIAAQPLPERQSFAKGGFFEGYTGSSFMSADETGERPVGLVKLHEKEWTAPRWMTQNPRLANTFEYLENVRKSKIIPMADGGYTNENTTTPSSNTIQQQINPESNPNYTEYISVLSDVKVLLQKLSDDGVMAYIIESADNGKKILRMIKSYEKIEQRASRK